MLGISSYPGSKAELALGSFSLSLRRGDDLNSFNDLRFPPSNISMKMTSTWLGNGGDAHL